jgi:hypothetical protein
MICGTKIIDGVKYYYLICANADKYYIIVSKDWWFTKDDTSVINCKYRYDNYDKLLEQLNNLVVFKKIKKEDN